MYRPEPIGFNVAVIDEEAVKTTDSGLYIPATSQETPVIATVYAVGDEVTNVAEGDRVAYKKGRGTVVVSDGKEYRILIKSDLITKLVED